MTKYGKSAIAIVAIALAAAAATPADASAQLRFAAAGGPSFPVGGLSDEADTGFNILLGAGLSVPLLPVGVRADGMLNQFPASEQDGNVRILSGSVNAVLEMPLILATPYLIGGLGVYNSRFTDGDAGSATDTGANIGAGIRLGLPGLNVFAETRFHNIFSEGSSTRFIPISLGVRL